MHIQILSAGVFSTLQDLGRKAFLSRGVPLSGAMDSLSAQIANIAVGNEPGAAVIEFTYSGASFRTTAPILMAYAGDGAILASAGKILPPDRPIAIPQGVTITLTHNTRGSRTYLSVAGGWDTDPVLGSRSTYTAAAIGGLEGRTLVAGDKLKAYATQTNLTQKIWNSLKAKSIAYPKWAIARRLLLPSAQKTIRIIPGREFTWFDSNSLVNLLSSPYTVSPKSNRMGYQLAGPSIERKTAKELLSTAVSPGAIQVTGSGNLILLLADCQTTGGYPRIAQVAAVDLPLCGQLKPGDQINFTEISLEEAEKQYIYRRNQLDQLMEAVETYYQNMSV